MKKTKRKLTDAIHSEKEAPRVHPHGVSQHHIDGLYQNGGVEKKRDKRRNQTRHTQHKRY